MRIHNPRFRVNDINGGQFFFGIVFDVGLHLVSNWLVVVKCVAPVFFLHWSLFLVQLMMCRDAGKAGAAAWSESHTYECARTDIEIAFYIHN